MTQVPIPTRLPPSVRAVYRALKRRRIARSQDLIEELGLSPRTVREALQRLVKLGLVRKIFDLEDARRCFYELVREVDL